MSLIKDNNSLEKSSPFTKKAASCWDITSYSVLKEENEEMKNVIIAKDEHIIKIEIELQKVRRDLEESEIVVKRLFEEINRKNIEKHNSDTTDQLTRLKSDIEKLTLAVRQIKENKTTSQNDSFSRPKKYVTKPKKIQQTETPTSNRFQTLRNVTPQNSEVELIPTDNSQSFQINKGRPRKKKQKKSRILVVGDSQARDMSWYLTKAANNFESQSYCRTGMPLEVVLHDVEKLIKRENLTNNDALLIMGGTNNFSRPHANNLALPTKQLEGLKKAAERTKVYISEVPYRYDRNNNVRNQIKEFNQHLSHYFYNTNVTVLPLNSIRRGDYKRDRYHLDVSGKQKVCRKLVNLISNTEVTRKSMSESSSTSRRSNSSFLGQKETLI